MTDVDEPRQAVDPEAAERAPRTGLHAGEGPAGRPLVERVGMAAIAAVVAVLFAGVGLAALASGELFLAIMAAIAMVMTTWAGILTLVRG